MRKLLIAALALTALATAGAAGAGGWATVGVSPHPPDEAGTTWGVNIRVLQHGRTPLDGVKPTMTIRNTESGETKTFPARPTGESGVYRAEVVFPSGGTWSYEVYDGFTEYGGAKTHTFAPVAIDGGGSSSPAWTIVGAAAAAVALVALLAVLARRRRSERAIPVPG